MHNDCKKCKKSIKRSTKNYLMRKKKCKRMKFIIEKSNVTEPV